MDPIDKRLRKQQFWAYLCYDTIEAAYERVEQLVESGRPMIVVERDMTGGELRVTPGVRIWNQGIQPGIYFNKTGDHARFSFTLDPALITFGYWSSVRDGDEYVHAERYHEMNMRQHRGERGYINTRYDVARIDIEGFGLGRNDHAIIRRYNNHGYGRETALYFHYEESGDRIKEETALIEALAGRDNWTAAQLCELIETAKVGGMSMIEAVEYLNKMHPKGN